MIPNERRHRLTAYLQLALAGGLLVLVNVLAGSRIAGVPLYGAWDLTEDRRFTLTEHTVTQLEELANPLKVTVLLAGDLPADYQRLADKVDELLTDLRAVNPRLEFEFSNPLAGDNEVRDARQRNLAEEGVYPVTVYAAASAAERSSTVVYPYAVFYYQGRTRIVPLLQPAPPGFSPAAQLNKAEALLEYNFSRAIEGLTDNNKPLIAFTTGNGELPPKATGDLVGTLKLDYEVGPLVLDSFAVIPQEVRLLVIAKPTVPFSDFDLFKIDQYVMNGGKVLWAVDNVGMDYDSLRGRNEFYPVSRELGVNELLFKYGVRMSPVLGLDLSATEIGIVTSTTGGRPNVQLTPFPYHVMAVPRGEHPIIKNLDPVDLRFPTVLEPVNERDTRVEKTVLLKSSPRARRKRLPAPIDLDAQKYQLDVDRFNEDGLPFAYLLEGSFTSPFANRLNRDKEDLLRQGGLDFRAESVPTRMVIVADGDILANYVRRDGTTMPLGFNPWQKFTYANKTFALNAIEYLLDPTGVIAARGKDVKLRLLDREEARAEAGFWRAVNIGLPLVLLAVFGLVFNWLRRRRYARPAARTQPNAE